MACLQEDRRHQGLEDGRDKPSGKVTLPVLTYSVSRQWETFVEAAAMGDGEAWAALVDCFGPKVWSVTRAFRLSPEDAADVSRAAWARMAEHLDQLPKPEAFGVWLLTIARRECLALVRRPHKNVPGADLPRAVPPDPKDRCLPEAGPVLAEQEGELWQAFGRLPPASQLLLRLLFSDPPLSPQ